MLERTVHGMAEAHLSPELGVPDPSALCQVFERRIGVPADPAELKGKEPFDAALLLLARARAHYDEREAMFGDLTLSYDFE